MSFRRRCSSGRGSDAGERKPLISDADDARRSPDSSHLHSLRLATHDRLRVAAALPFDEV